MKSDIEIAQAANMIPIWEVAEQLNIPKYELEMYGKYKDNNFRWSWTGYG